MMYCHLQRLEVQFAVKRVVTILVYQKRDIVFVILTKRAVVQFAVRGIVDFTKKCDCCTRIFILNLCVRIRTSIDGFTSAIKEIAWNSSVDIAHNK